MKTIFIILTGLLFMTKSGDPETTVKKICDCTQKAMSKKTVIEQNTELQKCGTLYDAQLKELENNPIAKKKFKKEVEDCSNKILDKEYKIKFNYTKPINEIGNDVCDCYSKSKDNSIYSRYCERLEERYLDSLKKYDDRSDLRDYLKVNCPQ